MRRQFATIWTAGEDGCHHEKFQNLNRRIEKFTDSKNAIRFDLR